MRIESLAFLGALALACSSSADSAANGENSDVFIAFAEDFRGYHAWEAIDVTSDAAAAGITDGSTLTAYINERPPHGSSEFPVGFIVVKEASGGTDTHSIFAGAKRGGGYNYQAPGWEWFELQPLNDGNDGQQINWRGVGPPAGSDTYGGDPNGGCNTCHQQCGNDGVCSPALNLQNF